MKSKSNQSMKRESGITLIALIITIILLVILAAVTIRAVYESRMVDYAINGTIDYAMEMGRENEIMSGTEKLIDSTVQRIEDILGGKDPTDPEPIPDANNSPVFEGTPTVAKVEESNTSLTITAKASDADNDELTYTLCDASGNAITTNVSQITNASGEVVFTHSGLENYSTHTYIVKVTDGKIAQAVPSNQCEGTTYCLGTLCSEGRQLTSSETCQQCNGATSICGGTRVKNTYVRTGSCSCGRQVEYWEFICDKCSASGTSSLTHSTLYSSTNVCPYAGKEVCQSVVHEPCSLCSSSGVLQSGTKILCSSHSIYYSHYFCSNHGSEVSQYH